ncbi:MAG: YeeE/YedE family protein [Pseudomonadota bacterium]|nr:YeeE/YedE family protein [Pseudomonadota bacterium]
MTRFLWAALVAGVLFGVGLAMSGMTDPQRVLGFLDVFGDFDPSLLFVLGGAVAVTATAFRFVLRRPAPMFANSFQISHLRSVDRQLLGGATLFGIGWGIAGYCPGPALAGLGVLSREALWFVPAMLAGALIHRTLARV